MYADSALQSSVSHMLLPPTHCPTHTHTHTHTHPCADILNQPCPPPFPLLPLSLCYWSTSPPLPAQPESLYWIIFKGIYKHKMGWMDDCSVGVCVFFLKERESRGIRHFFCTCMKTNLIRQEKGHIGNIENIQLHFCNCKFFLCYQLLI